MITLILHRYILPAALLFTIINEGIAASTDRYLMMYINNKAHKSEDGKTIIKTTQKIKKLCNQTNRPSHKK